MARLTPLETAVMGAMAWDLGDLAPDLAGQVEESLPGVRRNTGVGLYTELIVDRHRPAPARRATGLFGTVHAVVGDLADPVGFQVELRDGRLMALHGQSYGQDTRHIDFGATPFEDVFIVDDQGESIPYDPVALMPESPLLALQRHDDPLPVDDPSYGPLHPEPKPGPPSLPVTGLANIVIVAAYVLVAAAMLVAVFVARISWIFAFMFAAWAHKILSGKRVRQWLQATLNRAPASMGNVTTFTERKQKTGPARKPRQSIETWP